MKRIYMMLVLLLTAGLVFCVSGADAGVEYVIDGEVVVSSGGGSGGGSAPVEDSDGKIPDGKLLRIAQKLEDDVAFSEFELYYENVHIKTFEDVSEMPTSLPNGKWRIRANEWDEEGYRLFYASIEFYIDGQDGFEVKGKFILDTWYHTQIEVKNLPGDFECSDWGTHYYMEVVYTDGSVDEFDIWCYGDEFDRISVSFDLSRTPDFIVLYDRQWTPFATYVPSVMDIADDGRSTTFEYEPLVEGSGGALVMEYEHDEFIWNGVDDAIEPPDAGNSYWVTLTPGKYHLTFSEPSEDYGVDIINNPVIQVWNKEGYLVAELSGEGPFYTAELYISQEAEYEIVITSKDFVNLARAYRFQIQEAFNNVD